MSTGEAIRDMSRPEWQRSQARAAYTRICETIFPDIADQITDNWLYLDSDTISAVEHSRA